MNASWAVSIDKSLMNFPCKTQLFAQPFVQVQIKENFKVLHYWPLWGESTGGRWIPLTKGQ